MHAEKGGGVLFEVYWPVHGVFGHAPPPVWFEVSCAVKTRVRTTEQVADVEGALVGHQVDGGIFVDDFLIVVVHDLERVLEWD